MNSMVLAFVTIASSIETKDPNIFNLGPTLLTISTLIEIGVNLL
jgi:flagellar biosynthesis component FlhA